MFTTKEKLNTLKGRYERTRLLKKKRTLVTTLVNTTTRQMDIIKALGGGSGLNITAKRYGKHQLVTVKMKRG